MGYCNAFFFSFLLRHDYIIYIHYPYYYITADQAIYNHTFQNRFIIFNNLFEMLPFATNWLLVVLVRIWDISVNNILLFISGTSSHRHQCKVAFYNTCITREDCISSCSSMGASKYRWFRNGCCQCIGSRCHDFGELNPLCKECQADWSWSARAANSRSGIAVLWQWTSVRVNLV